VSIHAALRRQIVETARRLSASGLVAGSVGNVSARIEDGGALITPTRLAYELMAPEDVVRIAADGSVVEGRHPPSREWPTHMSIYEARPDVAAIVHSHSPHATAWSFLSEDLQLPTEELDALGGPIAIAAHGATGSAELAGAVSAALGPRQSVLMARHGVVGVGPDLGSAFSACALTEHQAQIEWILRGR
jgi:L-fuculose-phosphate aldolase